MHTIIGEIERNVRSQLEISINFFSHRKSKYQIPKLTVTPTHRHFPNRTHSLRTKPNHQTNWPIYRCVWHTHSPLTALATVQMQRKTKIDRNYEWMVANKLPFVVRFVYGVFIFLLCSVMLCYMREWCATHRSHTLEQREWEKERGKIRPRLTYGRLWYGFTNSTKTRAHTYTSWIVWKESRRAKQIE